jgi:hypothetical protein
MGEEMTAEGKEPEDLRLQRKKVVEEVEQPKRRGKQIGKALALLTCIVLPGFAFYALTAGGPVALLIFLVLVILVLPGIFGWPIMMLLYVTYFAYKKIRRLGYFPTRAVMLVLSVLIASVVLVLIVTIVLLPQPNSDWEKLGEILICIGIPMAFVPFGCAVLVRTLPKRDPRVFGRRRARFPFVWLGYLTIIGSIVGTAALMISHPEKNTFVNIVSLLVLLCIVNVFSLIPIGIGKRLRDQVTIEDAIKSDTRLVVLYLRPFAADEWPFIRGSREQILGKSGDDRIVAYTFEEYLRDRFWQRIGPFVALGNPEDYLPRPGAIRTYADDEGWYEYIERLAGQAACMVMLVSNSDNLQRELTFIRREGLQRRLFILTAVIDKPRRFAWLIQTFFEKPILWIVLRLYGPPHIEERATWEQLAQSVKKFGFDLGDDPGRGAVVTFDSEGKTRVLVKGAETPSQFVEAIREYLVTTLELDLGQAATEIESHQVVAAYVPKMASPSAG